MAQLAHCIHSTFGLHCCLLFLLASPEAGATPFQELHTTGESTKSGHLSAPTPGSVYSTPSDHIGLHLGHRPMDHTKSAETYQPKHHCKSIHHSKQIHKSIGNSKNSITHHEASSTSEQNPGNQEKDPIIRDKRSIPQAGSINKHKKSCDTKHPTPKSKSKITCPKSKTSRQTVTRNSNRRVTSLGNTISILDSKSTTSFKTTTLSHNSVNSNINKKLTSSSEKSTTFTSMSYKATRSIEMKERANDHTKATNYKTTVVSDKMQTNARKQTSEMPTGAEKHTQTPEKPTFDKKESTSVHTKKITSTKRRTTPIKISIKPTENTSRNVETTETMKSLVKVTEEKSISTSFPNKTAVTPQMTVGSFTPTSSMELNSITSEAPANKSHPYQNKGRSQGGLSVGVAGENDSFPVWAIVLVVLVAVILFKMFLGLIFLVSYMARTHCTLIHNTEDNDPEDDVGPHSYPVYLMEQQTLGVGQISSSQ
uniref:Mucin like 3 n=1 Tax=Rousettus aegyptiacus TaxID=9407 RepID=A0A7J8KD13_ROUAE|nr:hypothetical protein HJG63_013723 [Rousettus aegyptiacus]